MSAGVVWLLQQSLCCCATAPSGVTFECVGCADHRIVSNVYVDHSLHPQHVWLSFQQTCLPFTWPMAQPCLAFVVVVVVSSSASLSMAASAAFLLLQPVLSLWQLDLNTDVVSIPVKGDHLSCHMQHLCSWLTAVGDHVGDSCSASSVYIYVAQEDALMACNVSGVIVC
jgi:hypothetical protein